MHGQHVAGIIGATRDNGVGMDGVADVELMMLRVSCKGGDELDKDVASAIRYAVDNGAKVINMSFGKRLSPHSEWVYDAMRYAQRKEVLLVHAAGNDSDMIDDIQIYPAVKLPKKKPLKNVLTVGSNQMNGAPSRFSNYGKCSVDLFAPGDQIYSTVPWGTEPKTCYKRLSGTSMAAPVVSGVAALIWSYFPDLSVAEMKAILLETVTSRNGIQVVKPTRKRTFGKVKPDLIDFSDLCVTGGILNAYEAVKLAEKRSRHHIVDNRDS